MTDAGSAAVRAFHAGRDETARLQTGEGRVELLRTQQILRNELAPGSTILGVGGADGVHAERLEGDGRRVELRAAGFGDISVRGLEGPAWPLLDPDGAPDDPCSEQVAHLAALADRDDTRTALSTHLFALARAESSHPS